MARVDPEALEREADALVRQALGQADPATDTPPPAKPDDQTPPPPPGDTGEQRQEATDNEQHRGDAETPVDEERDLAVLRERYKNAQAAMTRATQRAAEYERQNGVLTARIAELEASGPSPAQAPQNADEAEAAIQRALKEYPEIVEPILARLNRVEAKADTIVQKDTDRQQQSAQEQHLNAIRSKHRDLDTIVGTDDFTGWVARQTATWQRVAQAGSAEDVIELLDRYKSQMGIGEAEEETPQETALERARRVAEPTLPRNRRPDPNANKKTWTRDEIRRMPLAEYEKHRADIDAAMAEGRIR